MTVGFQIGQCRIYVDTDRTKQYYSGLPKVSENCACSDCCYFETDVIKKDIRLFETLKKMGVDLTRQPNVNPDGLASTGQTEKYQRSYMGYYNVFGQLGKTQKSTQTINEEGQLESLDFFDPEEDSYIQYKVTQTNDDQLTIDFYVECNKKKN